MAKKITKGIRMDDETFRKLQQLAKETDRTMGSVVRVLIKLAETGSINDIKLPGMADET